MTTNGFVYVISNKSMPGLIKVGMSTRMPEERAKELSSDTSTPSPFIVEYYAIFDDMRRAERMVHQQLKPYHHGKEFFSTTVENAIYSIEELGLNFKKIYSRIDYENEIRERRIKEKEAKEKERAAKATIVQREKERERIEQREKFLRENRLKEKERAEERSENLSTRILCSILGIAIICFSPVVVSSDLGLSVVLFMLGIGFIVIGNTLFK